MNTVLSQIDQMLELCKQASEPRHQILPSTAIDKIEIKLVKARQDAELAAAAMCRACLEIGMPVRDVVSIDFGPVVDDE